MSMFKQIVEKQLQESSFGKLELTENFVIDNETRSDLRTLYKEIMDGRDYLNNLFANIQNINDEELDGVVEEGRQIFSKIGQTLIGKILGGQGTDALHDHIAFEIRRLIVDHPEIVDELEKETPKDDEIPFSVNIKSIVSGYGSHLSPAARELLKKEAALKYIRYLGAIRSYCGYGHDNHISTLSPMGRLLKDVLHWENKYIPFKPEVAPRVSFMRNTSGAVSSLENALSTLEYLGKQIFPDDRAAEVQ